MIKMKCIDEKKLVEKDDIGEYGEEDLTMPRVQKIKRKDKPKATYSVETNRKKKTPRRPIIYS